MYLIDVLITLNFCSKGVFTGPCQPVPKLGGHAMVVVGYGRQDGLDYWVKLYFHFILFTVISCFKIELNL
jgi:hypothetical protein